MKYDLNRISFELDETASGNSYYGNALLVCMDMNFLNDEDRIILKSYLTGFSESNPKNTLSFKHDLQDIAIKLREEQTRISNIDSFYTDRNNSKVHAAKSP